MASKGQSRLKVKKWIPAQVRSTALGAFEYTHGGTQEQWSNACLVSPSRPSSYLHLTEFPEFDHK
jgi:hypothetical protein